MTIAGNNLILGTLPALGGQDDGSACTSFGDVPSTATNNLAIASKQLQEVALPGAPAAMAANMAIGEVVVANPQAAFTAGIMMGSTRISATGVLQVSHGNMTAGPIASGLTTYTMGLIPNFKRFQFAGTIVGAAFTLPMGAFGNIGTLATVEGTALAFVAANSFMIASPTAALPAGLALSHCRTTVGNALVGLANPTAAPIAPGNVNFDVAIFNPGFLSVAGDGQSGPMMAYVVSGVSITHGVIAGTTVGEAGNAVALTDSLGNPVFQPGDVVHAVPRTASLGNVGLIISHARVSAAGIVQVGICNLTAGNLTPGANVYDILVVRPGPLF